MKQKTSPSATLLDWYDQHRRTLPWRALKGVRADPYRVWLSEVMLQQTTVKAVIPYFEKFTTRWPDVNALAAATDEEIMAAWAGLGYYSRARKLIECARAVVTRGGFPTTASELITLPGIGPYTSSAIAAIAFDEAATVIDGNVERVISRLHAIEMPLPRSRKEIRTFADAMTPQQRAGDFAQAMMDLGATICTPRNPACAKCPLKKICKAITTGDPALYPRKLPKKARPLRRAAAYWVTHNGSVLLRKRAAKGLLGGMMEVPSEGWTAHFDPAQHTPPFDLDFQVLPGVATHTFTHFDVEISVFAAHAKTRFNPPENATWFPLADIENAGLPSVMMKVVKLVFSVSSSGLAQGSI